LTLRPSCRNHRRQNNHQSEFHHDCFIVACGTGIIADIAPVGLAGVAVTKVIFSLIGLPKKEPPKSRRFVKFAPLESAQKKAKPPQLRRFCFPVTAGKTTSVTMSYVKESEPEQASARKDEAEPMLYCPVCSTRLTERKCKLFCQKCGYHMSCADYY
jgi:hypothetical protein